VVSSSLGSGENGSETSEVQQLGVDGICDYSTGVAQAVSRIAVSSATTPERGERMVRGSGSGTRRKRMYARFLEAIVIVGPCRRLHKYGSVNFERTHSGSPKLSDRVGLALPTV